MSSFSNSPGTPGCIPRNWHLGLSPNSLMRSMTSFCVSILLSVTCHIFLIATFHLLLASLFHCLGTFKMAGSHGWQIDASCHMGAQLWLWMGGKALSSSLCGPLHELLGLLHSLMSGFQSEHSKRNRRKLHGLLLPSF